MKTKRQLGVPRHALKGHLRSIRSTASYASSSLIVVPCGKGMAWYWPRPLVQRNPLPGSQVELHRLTVR